MTAGLKRHQQLEGWTWLLFGDNPMKEQKSKNMGRILKVQFRNHCNSNSNSNKGQLILSEHGGSDSVKTRSEFGYP